MKEENAYILGTDADELHRLGLQHQVWSSEAQQAWKTANFSAGQTLLDLGCGPGFCTRELAYITGKEGKVIGIDKSKGYIQFLQNDALNHDLPIEAIEADFDDMDLADESLDGMYCRWAMAWIPNPEEILQKVSKALKPGGKMVLHEYYDWSTHQTQPNMPSLSRAIAACLKSFKEQPGDIDVGRHLPQMLSNMGMKVTSIRPMSKLARPDELTWQWPKSFYKVYFPKLVEYGFITEEIANNALADLAELEQQEGSSLCCPLLIEVIAEKV
jgi:ubiquinone/menaquinone biosynthesis C-methylase UbiE